MAVAQCPASCGELIQGWILGSEKLVSCPVEWYSTVEVTSGSPLTDERPLSRAMVERLLLHWQYPAHMSQDIRIDVQSTIPVAKGMASSTADIAATAIATAQYLGHQLDESTLAQLCVSLEPTDSTVFRQLTLFDHNDASTQIACESQPQLDLLVLELSPYSTSVRATGGRPSSETRMGKGTGSLYQSKPLSDGRSHHAERDRQPVAVT